MAFVSIGRCFISNPVTILRDAAHPPPGSSRHRSHRLPPVTIDVLQIFFAEGAEQLHRHLEALEIKDLPSSVNTASIRPAGRGIGASRRS